MSRLGYDRYGVQGNAAALDRRGDGPPGTGRVIGVHVNGLITFPPT